MSLSDLQESAKAGKLVVVCGAGVSIALSDPSSPAPSWPALLQNGIEYGSAKGVMTQDQADRWKTAASSNDLDELLGAAQFVYRKLGTASDPLYGRWLEKVFGALDPRPGKMLAALKTIHANRLPVCTVNYDTLIEKATGQSSVTMSDSRSTNQWARGEIDAVLHLHGIWNDPETCVLGTSDYDAATKDEFRNSLQRSLSSFNRLVFVGCGETLKDPNLSNLIRWMKKYVGTGALQHYALVRDSEVDAFNHDPLFHGFVDPVPFGSCFDELPAFLASITDHVKAGSARKRTSADSVIVDAYREYLIRDCGKMTIEGVAADADTAKQRFDIERLFVPLSVDGVPPDFPANDPERDDKLRAWHEENAGRVPFGEALRLNKRLALLALPGGGKTLLLKRLAVAYADKERRTKTNDALPRSDLLPILIRCREWRDHIKLPIASIIERIGEITGQPELNGLYEAAKPRFQSGKLLLLIDGLDEIHNDADRATFVDHLEEFLERHPKTRLVVTSREAGFSLIAPNIARFCSRWRVSPLDSEAIRLLCRHWHALMSGDSADALQDAETVIDTIFSNDALTRLAENPLLLTMLLVVKHGHGRLPPDRVALYERAVDVLIDTWNIKGHSALNPKEAVPQLSYVALRMMKSGQQTLTEKELLSLLQECREKVSIVKLYSKDSPAEFLKRVELRSSLLLEAGRSYERGKSVPFYQFRHLTFQEYLAAVAAVEGNYDEYTQGASPLVPLREKILTEDWKEVVPMAAVLARKQAEPLLQALLEDASEIERAATSDGFSGDEFDWSGDYRMPTSASRLTQCLIEEAEFSPTTLAKTIQVVVILAHGCMGSENWGALMKGPFAEATCDEAWRLYRSNLPRRTWIRNTVAVLHGLRNGQTAKQANDYIPELRRQLGSSNPDEYGRAAASICGMHWAGTLQSVSAINELTGLLEARLDPSHPEIFHLTAWAIGLAQSRTIKAGAQTNPLSFSTLDKLVDRWQLEPHLDGGGPTIGPFALSRALMIPLSDWTPPLSPACLARINETLDDPELDTSGQHVEASALLAYHAKLSFSESQLARLEDHAGRVPHVGSLAFVLKGLGRPLSPRRVTPTRRAPRSAVIKG